MRAGPYELDALVGHGGLGAVYRARSPEGREVAVKVLQKLTPESRARFERERRLLASFGEAEGFVPLLDAGEVQGAPFIVMPFLAGGTLRERLARGPLGAAETLAVGRALARALGAAHARGVVHRDVKPENVLFPDSRLAGPLIADLGLGKHFDSTARGASQSVSISVEGTSRGTAGYVAPEQIEDAKTVGPPADVFSLGCVLYECLAGSSPFVADSALDVLTRVLDGKFEPLASKRPDAPDGLRRVIERALARDPSARYADGFALARALEGAGARRSRRAPLALAVVVVAAAAVALTWPRAPLPATEAARPDSASTRLVASGRARAAAEDWKGAIADYTRALEQDPKLVAAWRGRGWARTMSDDHAGAVDDATAALALDARDVDAWTLRGTARMHRRQFEEAIADFTRAIELDPKHAEAWANRGTLRRAGHDFAGGAEDLARACALDATHASAWLGLADCWLELDDLVGAIEAASRAIELAPGTAEAWTIRGVAHEKKLESDLAIPDLDRAIALDPTSGNAWAFRGDARGRRNDFEGGIADLTRALQLLPKFRFAWLRRGEMRRNMKDLDGALGDVTHAIDLSPDAFVYQERCVIRGMKGDVDGAIEDATEALVLRPDYTKALYNRGYAYEQKGDKVRARADYDRVIELGAKNPNDPMLGPARIRLAGLR